MRIVRIYGADRCALACGHAVRPSFHQANAFLGTKSNRLPMPWSVTTEGPGTQEVPI